MTAPGAPGKAGPGGKMSKRNKLIAGGVVVAAVVAFALYERSKSGSNSSSAAPGSSATPAGYRMGGQTPYSFGGGTSAAYSTQLAQLRDELAKLIAELNPGGKPPPPDGGGGHHKKRKQQPPGGQGGGGSTGAPQVPAYLAGGYRPNAGVPARRGLRRR